MLDILNNKNGFKRDLQRIKNLSEKIDKKLSQTGISEEEKIQGLTLEELQDLSKIVGLADFMLYKYEDKKDMRSILGDFVAMIKESAEGIDGLDDEISELILSAEDSIKKIKESHRKIYAKSEFEMEDSFKAERILAETGSINLTKFATEINAVEYQHNSSQKSE